MKTETLNRANALLEEVSEKGMIQLVNDEIIATAAYMTEEQAGVDFSEGEFWCWDETGVICIDADDLAEILEMIEEVEEGQREAEEEMEAMEAIG